METEEKAVPTSSQDKTVQKAKAHETRGTSPSAQELLKNTPRELMSEFFTSVPSREAAKWLLDFVPQEQLVSFLAQVFSDPGLRLGLAQWSERYLNPLGSFIEQEMERLSGLGITRETLALAMKAISFSRQIDAGLGELGDRRARHRRAQTLLKPVPVLQDLATMFGTIPDEVPGAKLPNPAQIITDLKLLSSMWHWGEWLHEFLGGNSFFEVSRFALASLVCEVSEHFLDSEVSCLISAAIDDADYDENRHRVWRINNSERLRENTQMATCLLLALNQVFSQSPNKNSET